MFTSGTIFSRRNKCLFLAIFSTVLFFILLLNIGVFSSVPTYTGELCKLDEIQVQGSFDRKKFAGNWYATFTKGLDNSLLANLLDFYDVKTNFILRDNGDFDIKSVGGKFYGMWCPEGLGHMSAEDKEYPQKLAIFFDTPTGKQFGTKPVWVLKTDYKR
ncbi:purpurin-like [Mercenaria mercenaria]|uniref:purpurin-like n=1 Tax=Mercenaria mercenaria TaxID=6596 RepID=UPI00234E90AB|nr:purpurin-like [Mercenaria mercenaria]